MEGYIYLHTLLGLFLMMMVLGCIYYIRIRHQRKIFMQILQLRRIIAVQDNQGIAIQIETARDGERMLLEAAHVGRIEYPISAYPPSYEEVQNTKTFEDKPPPYEELMSENVAVTTPLDESHRN